MTPEKKIFQPIPPSGVFQIYELLHREGLISFSLTHEAEAKVTSLVSSITGTYFDHEVYSTIEQKVVAYLYFLVKDHPFTDGNKRTASLVFASLCLTNNLNPGLGNGNPTLDELVVFIEKIQTEDHHAVIKEIAQMVFENAVIH